MKQRLDQELVSRKLVSTRSQAESHIKLGYVKVNGKVETKPGAGVSENDLIKVSSEGDYVSRAGLKLASVAKMLQLDFSHAIVLDVGSSTGGFTDYALQHGAEKVIAVELGKEQLHDRLRGDPRIELHEQTDIRSINELSRTPSIVVIDVSFISLRDILPHVAVLVSKDTQIVAMVKPQFEAATAGYKHKGVIKNDRIRRDILKDFENWTKDHFKTVDKYDSKIPGAKGNLERFYLLHKL